MGDTIKVLDKALDILELLAAAQEFMTAQRISNEIDIPKSTVHRLLNTLASRGYIRKDEKTHSYGIGLKLLYLKELTLDDLNLTSLANPILRSLARATDSTAHLATLSHDTVSYIDHWMSPTGVAIRTRLGEHAPLYCTSLGKALLAWLPEERLTEILRSLKFEPITLNTITNPDSFHQELALVRQQGFAEDREESAVGIRCIGAPIRDNGGNVVAAISITTLAAQVDRARRSVFIPVVKQHADELSAQLGYNKSS